MTAQNLAEVMVLDINYEYRGGGESMLVCHLLTPDGKSYYATADGEYFNVFYSHPLDCIDGDLPDPIYSESIATAAKYDEDDEDREYPLGYDFDEWSHIGHMLCDLYPFFKNHHTLYKAALANNK